MPFKVDEAKEDGGEASVFCWQAVATHVFLEVLLVVLFAEEVLTNVVRILETGPLLARAHFVHVLWVEPFEVQLELPFSPEHLASALVLTQLTKVFVVNDLIHMGH